MSKPVYLKNADLLAEIARSKNSYCSYVEPRYAVYDAIVDSTEAIDQATVDQLAEKTGKPAGDIVFRVMTDSHLPGADTKRWRVTAAGGTAKVNFKPFRHYVLRDGELVEVGRSHWRGSLTDGEFSVTHGQLTNRYALMLMMLAERYAKRANYRGYSFREDMEGSAIVQLTHVALQFDEARSNNPFSFMTSVVKNVFTRILNLERRQRMIRDDLLISHGALPSYGAQEEDYQAQHEALLADRGSPPLKRGPKPGRPRRNAIERTD